MLARIMVSDQQLFELRRVRFDTPGFRGTECIEVEAKTLINPVPGSALPFNWTINPYRGCSHACVYCFARPTHSYLDMNAGSDFETKIVVKVNAPQVLRSQLGSKRWRGEPIAMGTATDPYQRAEGRYRLMRGIIEALADYRNPFSILTKGTLIRRDVDLLVEASRVTQVSAALSIGTLDERAWRSTEPGTPHPRERMATVAALNEAGIPCGVLMAPILPGITDAPDQLREVVRAAIDAGATSVSPIMLHLRRGVREEFLPWLAEHHPDLVERYERSYRSVYGPTVDRRRLGATVAAIRRSLGGTYADEHHARSERRPRRAGSAPRQLRLTDRRS
jgi:DNA repair photolyase